MKTTTLKKLHLQTAMGISRRSRQALHANRPGFSYLPLPKFFHIVFVVFAVLLTTSSLAQVGINSFTSLMTSTISGRTYTGPGGGVAAQPEYIPASNNTFTYNFGATSGYATNVRSVNGYLAGGSSFSVIANVVTSVVMRRVNNAVVSGIRDILFFSGNRNPGINTSGQTNSSLTLNLNAGYVSSMNTAFAQNNLLIGTDNIFSNQGNGNDNNNNIERVDVMMAGGYTIPNAQKYGFPILERGAYGAHDAFKIAVITSVDILGNPATYSKVVSVTAANYNNTNAANPVADGTYNYFLFRRNGINDLQANQHINNQGIGGTAFRFSDFGIADGTTIYGYSILSNDFNSTVGADVVNYNNAARFPTNTSETTGGLDILAVLGIAMETAILPVELTSFTAKEKEGSAILEWTTVTEMDNNGFHVQHSINGKDWEEIGFVQTKSKGGNSTAELKYSFSDNNPGKGVNYYRLTQSDLNGVEKTSEIRSVFIGRSNTATIKLFPNPANSVVHVAGIEPGTRLTLVDSKSAIIKQFTAQSSTEEIPVEKLIPGIYFVQVIANNTAIKTVRFVRM